MTPIFILLFLNVVLDSFLGTHGHWMRLYQDSLFSPNSGIMELDVHLGPFLLSENDIMA